MALLQIAVLVSIVISVGAPAPHQTKFCQTCNGLTDPSLCTRTAKCHADEMCYTDVRFYDGEYHYFKGCRKQKECPVSNMVIGKRANHPDQHFQSQLLCIDCCGASTCNTIGCDQYSLQQTTPIAPTPAPTQPPQPPSSGSCQDHEEDGHNCSTYDQYNFCAETDVNTLAYNIAHTKCPKYCGFCGVSTPPPTTSVPCVDHEEDGFRCVDYDQYNFCTDVSSIAYVFSHQKCPKHCGFCQPSGSPSGSGGIASATTAAPVQVTMTSTHPPQPQNGGLNFVNVVVSQAPTTTNKPCADFEDSTFSCASWDNNGFCQASTGVLHEITVMRCSKFCKLC